MTSSVPTDANRAESENAQTLASPMHEGPGTRIGPYKILQLIGEGGFGSVFMAEQEKPVQRRVAIKIIKLGMDTRQVVARFEQERQALAMMDHPHIARVLDAGATDTGRPYFVMELVKGDPITEFCDRNSVSIRDRLELFAQVCAAVQHAHTKGIIHRDLKPTNILVSNQDGKPSAKVIDFGIAKATAARLTEKTLFTEHRALIGTPEYMSPEQAEGNLDIDTKTDVYSLGVLLYELLTGTTPFSSKELRSAAFAEIQRIIREVAPPRPSTRLSQSMDTLANVAARRHTEPRRLGTIIRGELDWIVMKAMDKDRARRYETANGLAADIRRYLDGEPVLAAPPSAVYRLRTFVRRHRTGVVAAALVVGSLVLGVVGTSIGLVNANRERRAAEGARLAEAQQRTLAEGRLAEAEATVKFLDDMLAAADPSAQGKDVTVRAVLDKAQASVAREFKDRPFVASRLHGTIARTYLSLGDYKAAESHARDSLETCQNQLGPDHPDTCRALNSLAGVMIKQARYKEVEPMLTTALADHERRFGRRHEITAQTIDSLVQLYTVMERRPQAVKLAAELLDIRSSTLGKDRIETISAMNNVALLKADMEAFDESERLYDEAIAITDRAFGPEHPLALEMRGNLAYVLYESAMSRASTDREGYSTRLERARTLGEQTLSARTRILGEDHPETCNASNNLGSVYRELKMWDEADRLALKDIEICVRTLGEDHPDTIVSIANMGNSYRARGRFVEAATYLDRALKAARKSHPSDFKGTAYILGWYGSCLGALGRFAEGEPLLLEARGIITRTLGENHDIAARMANDLRRLYADWDKAEPGKGYDKLAEQWNAKAGARP